jgi:hypothetical protein
MFTERSNCASKSLKSNLWPPDKIPVAVAPAVQSNPSRAATFEGEIRNAF